MPVVAVVAVEGEGVRGAVAAAAAADDHRETPSLKQVSECHRCCSLLFLLLVIFLGKWV